MAIELLLDQHVAHIHLNDSSRPIYAFWRAILNHTDEFCRLVASASLDIPEWKKRREVVRHSNDYDELELGFSTFYLNRCNRSGVLSGGVIGGLNQTGKWKMNARFSRNDLIGRIEAIAMRAGAITLRNWDAERFIVEHIPTLPEKTLVYCDPPYFEKASGLYLNHYKPDDHARIAKTIQEKLHKKWVVSYDSAPEILVHYKERESFLYDLQYNAATVYKGKEVFFFSDDLELPSKSSLTFIDSVLNKSSDTPQQLELSGL